MRFLDFVGVRRGAVAAGFVGVFLPFFFVVDVPLPDGDRLPTLVVLRVLSSRRELWPLPAAASATSTGKLLSLLLFARPFGPPSVSFSRSLRKRCHAQLIQRSLSGPTYAFFFMR